jgi:hypothetical protein
VVAVTIAAPPSCMLQVNGIIEASRNPGVSAPRVAAIDMLALYLPRKGPESSFGPFSLLDAHYSVKAVIRAAGRLRSRNHRRLRAQRFRTIALCTLYKPRLSSCNRARHNSQCGDCAVCRNICHRGTADSDQSKQPTGDGAVLDVDPVCKLERGAAGWTYLHGDGYSERVCHASAQRILRRSGAVGTLRQLRKFWTR